MTREPIFLEPVFKERLWGGTKLRDLFGYNIPTSNTGECWAVSAHPNGSSTVINGVYKGTPLDRLWAEHKELFGSAAERSDVFPLLTKVLDASQDLSVQVHPDDEYARKHENGELGKTECWYVLDAEPGAEIIYGHTAKSRDELEAMIRAGRWDELLSRVQVKPGDFFYVPSGTIHALGAGIVVLETQQSSDTTYRVYDYDRTDAEGNKRELHLEQAIRVTTVPHVDAETSYKAEQAGDATITTYVSNEFFTVQKLELGGSLTVDGSDTFRIYSVISGSGNVSMDGREYPLSLGQHFIIPAHSGSFLMKGNMELIVSWS